MTQAVKTFALCASFPCAMEYVKKFRKTPEKTENSVDLEEIKRTIWEKGEVAWDFAADLWEQGLNMFYKTIILATVVCFCVMFYVVRRSQRRHKIATQGQIDETAADEPKRKIITIQPKQEVRDGSSNQSVFVQELRRGVVKPDSHFDDASTDESQSHASQYVYKRHVRQVTQSSTMGGDGGVPAAPLPPGTDYSPVAPTGRVIEPVSQLRVTQSSQRQHSGDREGHRDTPFAYSRMEGAEEHGNLIPPPPPPVNSFSSMAQQQTQKPAAQFSPAYQPENAGFSSQGLETYSHHGHDSYSRSEKAELVPEAVVHQPVRQQKASFADHIVLSTPMTHSHDGGSHLNHSPQGETHVVHKRMTTSYPGQELGSQHEEQTYRREYKSRETTRQAPPTHEEVNRKYIHHETVQSPGSEHHTSTTRLVIHEPSPSSVPRIPIAVDHHTHHDVTQRHSNDSYVTTRHTHYDAPDEDRGLARMIVGSAIQKKKEHEHRPPFRSVYNSPDDERFKRAITDIRYASRKLDEPLARSYY